MRIVSVRNQTLFRAGINKPAGGQNPAAPQDPVGEVPAISPTEVADIRATKDNVGRAPIDPRILFCLWLYATLADETSGRRIAILTERDVIYEYLCGGGSVNYHTIRDFRSQHRELLKRVLTDAVAMLHHHGLVQLETIAQDGRRVTASAGSSSFRSQETLEESRAAARAYLEQLESGDDEDEDAAEDDAAADAADAEDEEEEEEEEEDADARNRGNDAPSHRQKSARERAAREKTQRLHDACEQMKELQEARDKRNSGKSEEQQRSTPRVSATDPDAHRMKMGDGGFRPACNVQFGSDADADALVIVDVNVETVGSDAGLLEPMHTRVCEQYDKTPEQWLADGGFSKKDGVTSVERAGTKFFGPVTSEKQILGKGGDPYELQVSDTDEYAAFRARIKSEAAQEIYRRRRATAEFPNAFCRNQALSQFRVRSRLKVLAQSLWHALVYNFQRFRNLCVPETQQSYLEFLNNHRKRLQNHAKHQHSEQNLHPAWATNLEPLCSIPQPQLDSCVSSVSKLLDLRNPFSLPQTVFLHSLTEPWQVSQWQRNPGCISPGAFYRKTTCSHDHQKTAMLYVRRSIAR